MPAISDPPIAALSALVLVGCCGAAHGGPVNPASRRTRRPAIPTSFIPGQSAAGGDARGDRRRLHPGRDRARADGNWSRAGVPRAGTPSWDPRAGVTIDVPGDRDHGAVEGQVMMTLRPVGNVDDIGSYDRVRGAVTTVPFQLALQEDGEWRITEAPDGLVLDRTCSRPCSALLADVLRPDWQFLVPDVRWFPATNAATYVTDALVDRPPRDWLAASVVTAFPESVSLRPSVPGRGRRGRGRPSSIAAGGVESDDAPACRRSSKRASRAAGITSVDMLVRGNASLSAETVVTRRTTVTGPPLVQIEQGFGFLVGDDLSTIPGLSAAMVGRGCCGAVSPNGMLLPSV